MEPDTQPLTTQSQPLAQPQPQAQPGEERPDFRKASIGFNTVASTAVGAALAIGIFAGIPALFELTNKPGARESFGDLIKKNAGWIVGTTAGIGAGSWAASTARNQKIGEDQPYVEKLEKQRDTLIAQAGKTL